MMYMYIKRLIAHGRGRVAATTWALSSPCVISAWSRSKVSTHLQRIFSGLTCDFRFSPWRPKNTGLHLSLRMPSIWGQLKWQWGQIFMSIFMTLRSYSTNLFLQLFYTLAYTSLPYIGLLCNMIVLAGQSSMTTPHCYGGAYIIF